MLWSDESTFQIVFGNYGRCILWAKEEKDHPDCFQRKVQKPASVMVWGCVSAYGMGNLHICEGTIYAERYIQVLEQNMLPSMRRLFQGHPCLFQQNEVIHHARMGKNSTYKASTISVLSSQMLECCKNER